MRRSVLVATFVGCFLIGWAIRTPAQSWITSKWLSVPASNESKQIQVVQLWEVRWLSHKERLQFCNEGTPEIEAFTSEAEAQAFMDALANAFILLRHECSDDIQMVKAK